MRYLLFSFFIFVCVSAVTAQDTTGNTGLTEAERYEHNYKIRIKKAYIDGIYIPRDVEDAIEVLIDASDDEGLDKMKSVPEEVAANGLRRGLGKWIAVRWGFDEGSRITHFIKTHYGVSHPKDITEFIIRALHRRLNNRPLQLKEMGEFMVKRRNEARLRRLSKKKSEVISRRKVRPEERTSDKSSK